MSRVLRGGKKTTRVRAGSTEVSIYEGAVRRRKRFTLAFYRGGVRQRRTFANLEKAIRTCARPEQHSDYLPAPLVRMMKQSHVQLGLDLGMGAHQKFLGKTSEGERIADQGVIDGEAFLQIGAVLDEDLDDLGIAVTADRRKLDRITIDRLGVEQESDDLRSILKNRVLQGIGQPHTLGAMLDQERRQAEELLVDGDQQRHPLRIPACFDRRIKWLTRLRPLASLLQSALPAEVDQGKNFFDGLCVFAGHAPKSLRAGPIHQ